MGHNDDTAPPAGGSVALRPAWTAPRPVARQAVGGVCAQRPLGERVERAPEDAAMTPAGWLRLALEAARRRQSRRRKVNTVATARRITSALAVLEVSSLVGCVSTPQGPPPGWRVRQISDPAPCEFRGTVTGGAVASETRALASARDNVARMGGNSIFVINVESRPWTFGGEEMPPMVTVTAEAYWCGSGTRASR